MDPKSNLAYHIDHQKKLLTTIKHNKTIIWITVIFYIITIILSIIYIYLPIDRIEDDVKALSSFLRNEATQASQKFDKVVTFIDKIEPDVDLVIEGVKSAIKEACKIGVIKDESICSKFGVGTGSGGSQQPVNPPNGTSALFNTRTF